MQSTKKVYTHFTEKRIFMHSKLIYVDLLPIQEVPEIEAKNFQVVMSMVKSPVEILHMHS